MKGKVGKDQCAYRPLINEEKREIHLTSYRAEIYSAHFLDQSLKRKMTKRNLDN